jgi:hypothetical protein
MSWDQLAANVGGYLGLFMGASMLSLCELIEISLNTCFIMFSRRKIEVNDEPNEKKIEEI